MNKNNELLLFVDGIPVGTFNQEIDYGVYTNETYKNGENKLKGILIPTRKNKRFIEIYNPYLFNDEFWMNIYALLYVDDSFMPSDSIKDCIININFIGNSLLEIGSRFKNIKTMIKIINPFYLKGNEYNEYLKGEKVYLLYDKPIKMIKDDKVIVYLGWKLAFDEKSKHFDFSIHFK